MTALREIVERAPALDGLIVSFRIPARIGACVFIFDEQPCVFRSVARPHADERKHAGELAASQDELDLAFVNLGAWVLPSAKRYVPRSQTIT